MDSLASCEYEGDMILIKAHSEKMKNLEECKQLVLFSILSTRLIGYRPSLPGQNGHRRVHGDLWLQNPPRRGQKELQGHEERLVRCM